MEEKANKVCTLFKGITGKKLDMTTYSDRLMLQKLVFLLQKQKKGLNFGYHFNWYVKGPYCTQLASDIFEWTKQKRDQESSLTSQEKNVAESLKNNFPTEVKSDEKLELLGSIVFIQKEWETQKREKIIEKLLSLKPWYEKQQIEEMLDKIEKSKLFN